MISISELISALPDILKYIVPGYIALYVACKLTDQKASVSSQLIISGVISFVTISALESIAVVCNNSWTSWGIVLVCIIVDVVCGILYAKIFKSERWKHRIVHEFGVVVRDGTISHFVDWENGTNAVVYLKTEDCRFLGHVQTVGDGNGDGMICLSEPVKYDLAGNEIYSHEGEPVHIIIPIKDIKYIELVN